ncbi:hypothetical protein B0J14DRAFT_703337 [Halenospora varia]|nr:hypothetical protein B0J14DRAFT_703337 [Halenospora varia]
MRKVTSLLRTIEIPLESFRNENLSPTTNHDYNSTVTTHHPKVFAISGQFTTTSVQTTLLFIMPADTHDIALSRAPTWYTSDRPSPQSAYHNIPWLSDARWIHSCAIYTFRPLNWSLLNTVSDLSAWASAALLSIDNRVTNSQRRKENSPSNAVKPDRDHCYDCGGQETEASVAERWLAKGKEPGVFHIYAAHHARSHTWKAGSRSPKALHV